MGTLARAGNRNPVGFHQQNRTKIEEEMCLGRNGFAALIVSLIAVILLAYSICYDCFVAANYIEYNPSVSERTKLKNPQIELDGKELLREVGR